MTPTQTPPQTAQDALMTIREMCDAFDVTPRTLRFYESKELLCPLRQGARRLYSRADRARLKLILRGKRFGFSLEDIRQVLNLYNRADSNLVQMQRTYDLACDRLAAMESQRAELDLAIADLKTELEAGAEMLAAARAAALPRSA